MSEVIFDTPLPEDDDFSFMTDWMIHQQEMAWQELSKVEFRFLAPTIINFMGDLHAGHPTTHLSRIEEETQAIKENPHSFLIALGDLVDGMNWNPGQYEQTQQVPEQIKYVQAWLRFLAEDNKLLVAIAGDHDKWMAKGGWDLYRDMHHYGAHATNGPTAIEATVVFDRRHKNGTEYRIGASHRLPGHSIYNPNHPQIRAEREIFRGADVVASGHTHRKGHARTYVTEWDNVRSVDMLNIGSYKPTDSWLKKMGFRPQTSEQMYGMAIKIYPGEKHVVVFDDILRANNPNLEEI